MFKNAKQLPATYYGRHFAPGVAEYRELDKEPFRIFINENVAKKMDPTFAGKPVYVGHVDKVNLQGLELEIDGVVFDSFYNKADGMHWVRFSVHTDRAHEAIRRGWKLSNAYLPSNNEISGQWHGVDYAKEVMDAEYEHLAIVDDPRYSESIILTPEEFKAYNEKKELELKTLSNSKEKVPMKLNIFRRVKVENSKEVDFDGLMVTLPKSKKEMLLTDIVEEMDTVKNMHGYANGDHMVKMNDTEEMSVNAMMKELSDCRNKLEAMKKMEEPEGEELENEAVTADEDEEDLGEVSDEKLHPKNAEDDEDKEDKKETKKNSKETPKVKRSPKFFEQLKNAREESERFGEENAVYTNSDRVDRGKQLFGSN